MEENSGEEISLSQPFSRQRGGGRASSPGDEGLGESQFRRLEKNLSTLPTLWVLLMPYGLRIMTVCHCAWSQFKHLTHTKGSSPKGGGGGEGGGRQIFEPLSLTERLSKQLALLPDILKGKLKNSTKNYDFDGIFFRFISTATM
jgi:hypothetical protein